MDPVLLLWLGSEPLAGRLLRASRSPPRLVQTVGRAGARSFRVETRGTSSFDLAAELWPASSSIAVERGQRAPAPGAALVRYSVEGTLRASNANDVDPAGGVTNGKMESTTSNTAFDARGGMRVRHSAARYPYHVEESEEKVRASFPLCLTPPASLPASRAAVLPLRRTLPFRRTRTPPSCSLAGFFYTRD